MKKTLLVCLLIFISGAFGPLLARQLTTTVSGQITVDRNIDNTGDYSGIKVNIVRLGGTYGVDTLYTAISNIDGTFSGTARFPERAEYLLTVSRYGISLATSAIVLQQDDPVNVTGELPHFDETKSITSGEQTAMATFRRVDRNYNRVVSFINSGAVEVTQDTIPKLVRTWSDLFWSIRDSHPNTLAADIGTVRSLEILSGYDDQLLIRRAGESLTDKSLYTSRKTNLAAGAMNRVSGLRAALSFMESVMKGDIKKEDKLDIEMRGIEMLIEAGYGDEAKQKLTDFRRRNSDNATIANWVDILLYDIEHLFPGLPMPDFDYPLQKGGNVSHESMKGTLYLKEIVDLTNPYYQTEATILNLFFLEYKDKGLNVLSVPINRSPVAVNAFIDDRSLEWPVTRAAMMPVDDIIEKYNLTLIPTRFLVDENGTIIRKYSGTDIAVILNDIRNLLEKE